jgi:hypothetical protein
MKRVSFLLSVVILAIFIGAGCMQTDNATSSASKAATYYGDSKPFGGDSIRSWYKTDAAGNLASIGVSFKQSAFAILETQSDTMFTMILPHGINTSTAWGIDHIEVDWSSNGDAAPSVFNIPHIDAHFFAVDTMTQNGVAGGADPLTINMGANYLPPDYVLQSTSVPGMGVHAMDTTGKEFHGQPFDHSLIYGYYHADMYFIEPIISKAYLDVPTNFNGVIKQPSAFKFHGVYPTTYNIRYDGSAYEFQISIDNFVTH